MESSAVLRWDFDGWLAAVQQHRRVDPRIEVAGRVNVDLLTVVRRVVRREKVMIVVFEVSEEVCAQLQNVEW